MVERAKSVFNLVSIPWFAFHLGLIFITRKKKKRDGETDLAILNPPGMLIKAGRRAACLRVAVILRNPSLDPELIYYLYIVIYEY